MKVEVLILILLLGSVFVSAELSVSCTQDSDCALALGDESYSCVESLCEKENVEEIYVALEPEEKSLEWNFVSIEEKETLCAVDGCLSFAPKNENNSWWRKVLDFLLYL